MIPTQNTLDNLVAQDYLNDDKTNVSYLIKLENQRVYEIQRGFR